MPQRASREHGLCASLRRLAAPPLAALTALGLSATLAIACAQRPPDAPPPQPALTDTAEAATAFSELRARWLASTDAERIALEPRAEDLRRRFSAQRAARLAEVLLAWTALSRGDRERAHALATSAGAAFPGHVRDIATLVDGAAHARSGDTRRAHELLLPLRGRLLDPFARALLHEELTRTLLAEDSYTEAIAEIDEWLRESSDEEQAALLERLPSFLERIPAGSLEAALESRRASPTGGAVRSQVLEKAMLRRLFEVARQRNDPALARRIISYPGALVVLGATYVSVVELANRYDVPQVDGRLAGLLLPSATALLRNRGAEVSLGMMATIGPADATTQRSIIVRHDGGSLSEAREALASLDAGGAAIIVGGLDGEEARLIAQYAENEQIAALLLAPPTQPIENSRWSFVLGPALERGTVAALDELVRKGASTVGVVGATAALVAPGAARVLPSLDCTPFAPGARIERYPLDSFRAQKADALLLAGDPRCAHDVLEEARRSTLPRLVGLGLEASSTAARQVSARTEIVAASLGCYPLDAQSSPPPSIAALASRTEGAPSFWAVLGADAASLASAALTDLPPNLTLDEAEVRARRETVRKALASSPASPCLGLHIHPTSQSATPIEVKVKLFRADRSAAETLRLNKRDPR